MLPHTEMFHQIVHLLVLLALTIRRGRPLLNDDPEPEPLPQPEPEPEPEADPMEPQYYTGTQGINHGKRLMCYQGNHYRATATPKGREYWRCILERKTRCKAKIYINEDGSLDVRGHCDDGTHFPFHTTSYNECAAIHEGSSEERFAICSRSLP